MTPKFLREEAARFRGMAEATDREASKQRLLSMAVDYEARARMGDPAIEPNPGEAIKTEADRNIAKEPDELAAIKPKAATSSRMRLGQQ